ncbi:hypothetical protein ACS0TY_033524 [Phlomoides rotata]
MCCWNNTALGLICSKIGRPIHTDCMMFIKERVSCVRVLVEVDAAEPLVREVKIRVEGVEWMQPVDYEFEPKYCKTCDKFDHGDDNCPLKETWEQKRAAYFKREEEKIQKKKGKIYEKNIEKDKGVASGGNDSDEGFVEVINRKQNLRMGGSEQVSNVEVGNNYSKGKGRFDVLREEEVVMGEKDTGPVSNSNPLAELGTAQEEVVVSGCSK